jgi:large subunit ribosomal protein L9
MLVLLKKDIENVGMAGHVVKVTDGYAMNFLVPRKFAIVVQESEIEFYKSREKKEIINKEILSSKIAMLAERIKNIHLSIKKRAHDDGKLYGSVGADEVVSLLKEKDIKIDRKQVDFEKSIRITGEHKVTIKLTSKLKPQCTLNVVGVDK